jgi:hypothetical protein
MQKLQKLRKVPFGGRPGEFLHFLQFLHDGMGMPVDMGAARTHLGVRPSPGSAGPSAKIPAAGGFVHGRKLDGY